MQNTANIQRRVPNNNWYYKILILRYKRKTFFESTLDRMSWKTFLWRCEESIQHYLKKYCTVHYWYMKRTQSSKKTQLEQTAVCLKQSEKKNIPHKLWDNREGQWKVNVGAAGLVSIALSTYGCAHAGTWIDITLTNTCRHTHTQTAPKNLINLATASLCGSARLHQVNKPVFFPGHERMSTFTAGI